MRTVLLLLALSLVPTAARAGVEPADGTLREGAATSLVITRADGTPAAGAAVVATYRPGSNIPHEVALGTAGEDGRLAWTPEQAGLVTVSATAPAAGELAEETSSVNLSVRHAGTPVGGLVIMLLAGIILYGGVFRGFRNLG